MGRRRNKVKKWEYLNLNIISGAWHVKGIVGRQLVYRDRGRYLPNLSPYDTEMASLVADGWLLISISENDIAYFKRRREWDI